MHVSPKSWKQIILLLLTGVEKVCLGFGTPEEKQLDSMTVEEATRYISENQFSSGAMLPKVEAAVSLHLLHLHANQL